MVQDFIPLTPLDLLYPDSDGQPMADNTLQFQWIVTIKENLELLFAPEPNVFVAGDLLWYPVQGQPKIRRAPDAMVVIGRPKGYRGSYKQWEEANIAPQVVFEVLSPGNTISEMAQKLEFYQTHGVEEYYLYNPYVMDLGGWQRQQGTLTAIQTMNGWTSPRLGIRFETTLGEPMQIFMPDGSPFLTFAEVDEQRQQAEAAREKAEAAQQQAEQERDRAQDQATKLAQKLRELGIDPDSV
ncbi:MAG: Uma2 family endonuclease [Spirulinaceae cyanobacterium]